MEYWWELTAHQFCFVLHCVLCFAVGILGWADHLHCGKIPERRGLQLTVGAVLGSVGAQYPLASVGVVLASVGAVWVLSVS